MSKSTLRLGVIILTVVTAVIHLILGISSLIGDDTGFGVLFVLNAIGYSVLLGGVVTGSVPVLSANKTLAHYALMAFALATLILYFVFNGLIFSILAVIAKTDELLLIITTWLHLNASQ